MEKFVYNKTVALVAQEFGLQIIKYLKKKKIYLDTVIIDKNYRQKDKLSIKNSKIARKVFFANDVFSSKILKYLKKNKFDQCLSFWWPYILKNKFLKLFHFGIVNCHAGYLPYERGLHSYVHSIKKQHPKGVTLHYMDKSGKVDMGKIIFQKKIKPFEFIDGYNLEKILYKECLNLYQNKMNYLISKNFNFNKLKLIKKTRQNFRKNLDKETFVNLNKKYVAKDLIYIILSRSGFKKGGAHFKFKNKRYEMSLKIREK